MKYKLVYLLIPLFFSCKSDELDCCGQLLKKLPEINIETENYQDIISKDDYITGTFEFFSNDYEFENFSFPMKIRGRGNSSWNFPKKSYQFKFDDKYNLFDMPEDKKWLMLANYSDKTMIRNAIAFELGYLSSLDWSPGFHFAEVSINGESKGLYQFTEKVETGDSNRVKIGDEGYLLEVDQLDRIDDDDIAFWTNKKILFVVKDPDLEWGSVELEEIESYINETENILYGDTFKDPDLGYSKYIDVDSFVDWYIINEISKNNDAIFLSSVYMNYVSGEKLKMGPIWDFNLGFGNVNYCDGELTSGWSYKFNDICGGDNWKVPFWWNRLFEDPAFVTKLKNRWSDLRTNILSDQNLQDRIEKITNFLIENNAPRRNFDKWSILGKYVWPNNYIGNNYTEEISYLKNWITKRVKWMDEAINSI